MTSDNGTEIGSSGYEAYGNPDSESGALPEQRFTGQRLDDTGLYFFNARYYDATIGRFISPDTIIPSLANPQAFNRYSYCLNNPQKYIDPSGHIVMINGWDVKTIYYALAIPEIAYLVADVASSPEFLAYNAFKESGEKAEHMAWTMEESTDHTITIQSNEKEAKKGNGWVNTNHSGSDFVISLNPGMWLQGYDQCTLTQQASFIDEQVRRNILDTQANYDYLDAIWEQTVGEIVSLNGKVDAAVTIAQFVYDWRSTNIALAFIDLLASTVPGSAFLSNLVRQQDAYDQYMIDNNIPYPFRGG